MTALEESTVGSLADTERGYAVIDADGHVMEPDSLWLDHIEPRFRDRAPRRARVDGHAWGQMVVDGVPMYRHYPDELVQAFQDNTVEFYGEFAAEGFTPQAHVRALDAQGVDITFLYPSLGLGVAAIDGLDPELAVAICRAYNTWLVDYCSYRPDRLRPVALLSLHSPKLAVGELERVVGELGIRSVMLRPNMVDGRHVGHPEHEPFWARCEELGVSVSFHEGCHTMLPAAGADRFTSHFAMHACCHPIEQMMAFVGLLEGGVLERHPGLRVAFLEAGVGWVPYLLWRLDDLEYKHWRFQVPDLKREPSEYFARQCWVTVEGCEPYLRQLVPFVGEDRLLFASDYPHPDHRLGEEIEDVKCADLDDGVRRKILSDNPRRFYAFEES